MTKKDQQQEAMNRLFDGLSAPETSPRSRQAVSSESVSSLSPRRQAYDAHNERVCTILDKEKMNKIRYIHRKEGIPLRDIFDTAITLAISSYESVHGVIKIDDKRSKADAKKIFGL